MSCQKQGQKYSAAARQNGIGGQVSRYLNTLGSWQTYQNIDAVEDIPERVAQVTEAFFGIKDLLKGQPRIAGVLGAIIAVHALEQVTAGLATTGMRLYARGQPVASYRGVLVRKSPLTPKTVRVLNRLTGDRVQGATGYYFFEGGKTWHCQSTTLRVGDEPRTLTRLQSFSIPQRDYFFDRPVSVPGDRAAAEGEKSIPMQRMIDTVKGDENPDMIPGFIGSINELEGITPLKGIKLALFAANWLLVDPGEREGGGVSVDYGALGQAPRPGDGSRGGVYQATRPAGGSAAGGATWPSTTRIPVRPAGTTEPLRPVRTSPPPAPAYGANLFRSGSGASQAGRAAGAASSRLSPAEQYKDRIRIDGQDYPLVVKRVVLSPFSHGGRKADAIYYDEAHRQWREVVDEADRVNLAKAIDEGRLSVVEPSEWPKT